MDFENTVIDDFKKANDAQKNAAVILFGLALISAIRFIVILTIMSETMAPFKLQYAPVLFLLFAVMTFGYTAGFEAKSILAPDLEDQYDAKKHYPRTGLLFALCTAITLYFVTAGPSNSGNTAIVSECLLASLFFFAAWLTTSLYYKEHRWAELSKIVTTIPGIALTFVFAYFAYQIMLVYDHIADPQQQGGALIALVTSLYLCLWTFIHSYGLFASKSDELNRLWSIDKANAFTFVFCVMLTFLLRAQANTFTYVLVFASLATATLFVFAVIRVILVNAFYKPS